jgi:hypothetical protein
MLLAVCVVDTNLGGSWTLFASLLPRRVAPVAEQSPDEAITTNFEHATKRMTERDRQNPLGGRARSTEGPPVREDYKASIWHSPAGLVTNRRLHLASALDRARDQNINLVRGFLRIVHDQHRLR